MHSFLCRIVAFLYIFEQVYGFADVSGRKMQNLQLEVRKSFAPVSVGEEKSFDFLRILFGMFNNDFLAACG